MSDNKPYAYVFFPSGALDNPWVVDALMEDTRLTRAQALLGDSSVDNPWDLISPAIGRTGLTMLKHICPDNDSDPEMLNLESALMGAGMAYDMKLYHPDTGFEISRWRPGHAHRAWTHKPGPVGEDPSPLMEFSQERDSVQMKQEAAVMVFPNAALDNVSVIHALSIDAGITETAARSGRVHQDGGRDIDHLYISSDGDGLTHLTRAVKKGDDSILHRLESALMTNAFAFDRRHVVRDEGGIDAQWRPGMAYCAEVIDPEAGNPSSSPISDFSRERQMPHHDDSIDVSMG